jgi:hypothetical protein
MREANVPQIQNNFKIYPNPTKYEVMLPAIRYAYKF